MIEGLEIIKNNNRRRRPIFIWLGMIALIFGVTVDGYFMSDSTVTIAYIPLMVMVGFLSSHLMTNIILSGVAAITLQVFSPNQWEPELFFLRWLGYFFIAFVIRTLYKQNTDERNNLINFTLTLAQSLDARDKYTAFHSKNVAYYSYEIAQAIHLSQKECDHLYLGGLLHDIGKIGIPESILNKPSKLTLEEFEIIKEHPQIGYDMLQHVPAFRENSILDMVLHHHERYDGKGYPHGLRGEEIPLVARIMAVADSFDAMTSKRAYRNVKEMDYAINEIRNGKQSQFDPNIADVFLELIDQEKIIVRGFE